MEFLQSSSAGTLVFHLRGRFTFSDYPGYGILLDQIRASGNSTVIIDFSGVEFVDSAALGMLLIARDVAAEKSARLQLRNPTGQVLHTFELACFDTLFEIDLGVTVR